MGGFILLFALKGPINSALTKVFWIDVLAVAILVVAYILFRLSANQIVLS